MAEPVLTKSSLMLEPDPSRTVIRPFGFSYPAAFAGGRPPRAVAVARHVMALDAHERAGLLAAMLAPMRARHRNADTLFLRRFEEVRGDLGDIAPDVDQRLLIGAYFSQEYAFESAALFNPSIVRDPRHPVDAPDTPFVLSLRGIGEGHISSITFRTGHWAADGTITVDPASAQGVPPRVVHEDADGTTHLICHESRDISETVIFPVLASQRNGVEDLRLVNFTDDDGSAHVYGTYTAYDGRDARQEMMSGVDFRSFTMRPLRGAMTAYKGMALFPRRIDGRYVMLGRQDSENIWLLTSDDLWTWETGTRIMAPRYPWEYVQLGNCGSPIEIDEGWLVFTHGVGMVRGYSIGACLLDKADPTKVLARTPEPLLYPSVDDRGGYVPNVVYGCGALVRGRNLLLPYAVADEYATFATGTVDAVLAAMA